RRFPRRCPEPPTGLVRERVVGSAELAPVSPCLLEVEADDLEVVVDPFGKTLLEPAGVALVQPGAEPLRHRDVGGGTDENVAHTKAVVPGKEGAVRAEEFLAHEAEQMRAEAAARLVGKKLGDRAGMEQSPLDGGSREYVSFFGLEAVDA